MLNSISYLAKWYKNLSLSEKYSREVPINENCKNWNRFSQMMTHI